MERVGQFEHANSLEEIEAAARHEVRIELEELFD
jgi:hypothetical protein